MELIGASSIRGESISPTTWRDAAEAYLAAMLAKDTKGDIPFKAIDRSRTPRQRRHVIMRFVQWAEAQRERFMGRPFTEAICEFIQYRVDHGDRPTTIHSGYKTFLALWGEWMAKRGIVWAKPDRDRIREVCPRLVKPLVILPERETDYRILKYLYDERFHSGSDWQRNRAHFSIWAFILLVRGLGCRPTEALTLQWDTVKLLPGKEKVLFMKPKESWRSGSRYRTVPVLWEWVRKGLEEMRERWYVPGKPVLVNAWNKPWTNDDTATERLQAILADAGLPAYTPKESQKLAIDQMLRAGFPADAIAKWTGHNELVMQQHYQEEGAHLPPDAPFDYKEFGVLSDFGRECLEYTRGIRREPWLTGDGGNYLP